VDLIGRQIYIVHKYSSYRAVDTLRRSYTNQSVTVVQWNNRCLFWDPHKTHKHSPYRAVNTLRRSYTNQSVNAVQWNNRCLFWDPHKTHKWSLWAERRNFKLQTWWDIKQTLELKRLRKRSRLAAQVNEGTTRDPTSDLKHYEPVALPQTFGLNEHETC
jgi:hypothetical protein